MSDETSIKKLGLTIRTYNKLIAENILTIEKLETYSAADLLKTPNLGKKSFSEIQDALDKYRKQNNEPFRITFDILKDIIEQGVHKSIKSYLKRVDLDSGLKNMIDASLSDMKNEIHNSLFANINEIRTLVLEQSRILEGMQSMQAPNSIINKISEKVPGFNTMIYELYKTLEK